MPAYNAGKVISGVIERIPKGLINEIIIVDDASRDNTFDVLSAIPGLTVLRHAENRGYGGAQITLHDAAIQHGADVAVLMHSDGGHFPEELPRLLEPILAGEAQWCWEREFVEYLKQPGLYWDHHCGGQC